MSLEDRIAANTAALEANTKAVTELQGVWQQLVTNGKAAADNVAAGSGLKAGGKEVIPPAGKGKVKDVTTPPDGSDASTVSSGKGKDSPPAVERAVERADMSKAIVSLCAKHGRPKALEVLADFESNTGEGVATKGAEVKDEDIPAVFAAVTAALEAESDEGMG